MVEIATICLALNIYFEARGEPLQGQIAVAQVTMNRAGRDPSKVCHEVARHKQFSWTITKVERLPKGGWRLKQQYVPRDMKAWDRALVIARAVASGRLRDMTGGATHYHANYVKPAWRTRLVKLTTIGAHIFYRSA